VKSVDPSGGALTNPKCPIANSRIFGMRGCNSLEKSERSTNLRKPKNHKMKKLLFCLILLAETDHGFAQQLNNEPARPETDYLKKSGNKKTVAWSLLGGGTVLAALGTVRANPDYGGENSNARSNVFLATGLTAMAASIPFFIASSKNKKKATTVGFMLERHPVVHRQGLAFYSCPGIAVKFSIN
jgi:hypothetical protein